MKKLSENQMKEICGGQKCAVEAIGAIIGIGSFLLLFSNPLTATGAIAAPWLFGAIFGPTGAGISIGLFIDDCIC